jgi:flavin-binding protein dodecin
MSGSDIIEKVGVSTESYSDAVKKILHEVRGETRVNWFQVVEQRGRVSNDGEIEFQVIVKMGI